MPNTLIIIGGGALGLEVEAYALDQAQAAGRQLTIAVYDHGAPRLDHMVSRNVRHLADLETYRPAENEVFAIAIGEPEHRARFARLLDRIGGKPATIIHPKAYVAATACIEPGAIVAPFAFVGPQARIGRHAMINTHASVGHDCVIGEASSVSPHAILGGFSHLGRGCLLGSGAIIQPKVILGGWSKISAGSVLTRDAPAGSLIHGNPGTGRVMFRIPEGEEP